NIVLELSLDLLNGSRQVAAPDAEFDRDIAAAVLAIDHEGALAEADFRHLPQRHPVAVWSGQENVLHGFGVLAILRLVTNDEIKPAVAFENLRYRRAANGGLHGRVNIGGHQPIASRPSTINGDNQVRLPGLPENCKIGNAGNGCHSILDPRGRLGQHVDAVTEELE